MIKCKRHGNKCLVSDPLFTAKMTVGFARFTKTLFVQSRGKDVILNQDTVKILML